MQEDLIMPQKVTITGLSAMGTMSAFETQCLRRAIELAKENSAQGYFPYAALLVDGEEVLGEAVNTVRLPTNRKDFPIFESPLAHPESALVLQGVAIAEERFPTDKTQQRKFLSSLTIVSNIEPCPMCARAMAGALMQKVFFAVDGDTALRVSGVKDPSFQDNALTFQSEYGLEYRARGPHLKEEALPLFVEVWGRVRAISQDL